MQMPLPDKKIYVKDVNDIYKIMQKILVREYKNGRKREYFWAIGLDVDHTISYIELVGMGTKSKVVVEAKEVYSFAVEKRVKKMFFVHNHPEGKLEPSEGDLETTKALMKAGLLLEIPVIDHLIIDEKSCYSMLIDGPMLRLMDEVRKEAPELFEDEIREEAKVEEKKATALKMLGDGLPVETIIKYTGLSLDEIKGFEVEGLR